MATFSPGPWRVEEGAAYAGPPIIVAAYGEIVAGCMGSGTQGVAQDNANAHLMAAAPDLLAACEAYVAAEDGSDLMTAFDGMTRARALMDRAIAKAKGGAQ